MNQPKLLPQTKQTAEIQKRETATKKSGTPYDDAFHTLVKSYTPLLLPVINEMFGEHYTQAALDAGELAGDTLHITIPNAVSCFSEATVTHRIGCTSISTPLAAPSPSMCRF